MGNLGVSRQFAFIRFHSVPDARAFLEKHYPTLNLGHGADRCRVAFSRERENDDRRGRRRDEGEEEWKCRVVSILLYILDHGLDGRHFFAVCIFANRVCVIVSSSELPPATGMFPLPNAKIRFVLSTLCIFLH